MGERNERMEGRLSSLGTGIRADVGRAGTGAEMTGAGMVGTAFGGGVGGLDWAFPHPNNPPRALRVLLFPFFSGTAAVVAAALVLILSMLFFSANFLSPRVNIVEGIFRNESLKVDREKVWVVFVKADGGCKKVSSRVAVLRRGDLRRGDGRCIVVVVNQVERYIRGGVDTQRDVR